MIYICSNNNRHLLLRPALHFTSHHTSPHFTSLHLTSLHLTSPHFTSLHFTSPHFTSPHFTSPHFTSLHFTSPHFTSPHFTSPHFQTIFTKLLFLSHNLRFHISRFSTYRFWYWQQTRTRPILPRNSSVKRKACSPTQRTVAASTDARPISKRITNRVSGGLTIIQSQKAAVSEDVLYGPNPRDLAYHNSTRR